MIRRNALRTERGFTLIELLVVVAIIAIVLGAVIINISFSNPGIAVRDSARRTALLMELAADQAVYSRQQLGIRFHPGSYEFYVLTAEEGEDTPTWQILPDERLMFETVAIPIEFQVDISGVPILLEDLSEELDDASDEEPLKPHIMFLSNGDLMPDFRLVIADAEGEHRWQVATGEIEPVVVEQLQ